VPTASCRWCRCHRFQVVDHIGNLPSMTLLNMSMFISVARRSARVRIDCVLGVAVRATRLTSFRAPGLSASAIAL
jgi:hypothetical protein